MVLRITASRRAFFPNDLVVVVVKIQLSSFHLKKIILINLFPFLFGKESDGMMQTLYHMLIVNVNVNNFFDNITYFTVLSSIL